MAHFNFIIPSKLEELLKENSNYFVRDILVCRELLNKLTDAREFFKEQGPEFILDNFDVFYSILHHEASLPMDMIFKAYQDLHKAATGLIKPLQFLLEDKSLINCELRQKYQNVLKMLIYIYVQTVLLIENKNVTASKNQGFLKRRKRLTDSDTTFNLDKRSILLTLNTIIQNEIGTFWDPPIVEENFINVIAEVCYKFLQNPLIKGKKDEQEEVFHLIGTLMKSYNHNSMFTIRIVQMLKEEEHLIQCLSQGLKQLVEGYNCKGLVHALVKEITEWQTNERYQDSQGSRFCAQCLTAMATLMPNLMLPELLYLNKYLYEESATLRNAVLNVITEIIINVLTKETLSKEEKEYRHGFMSILFEHISDNSALVRTKVLQHWARLQKEFAVPRDFINEVLTRVVECHLHDRAAFVRKSAAHCVITFLTHNMYGAELSLKKIKAELEANESLLKSLEPQIDQAKAFKAAEMEAEWLKLVPDLEKVLLDELQKEDEEDREETETRMDKTEAMAIIRLYLNDGKYKDAFQIWKSFLDNFDEIDTASDKENVMGEFLSHLKVIYMQGLELLDDIRNGISHGDFVMTEDDFMKFEVLKHKVQYLTDEVTFLELINTAIELMIELLETTCISDMQEAVSFFTLAYQFRIDNADNGITAMLNIMKRNEQDRKDMIIEAFKNIYLKSNASNLQEHCTIITNRLVGLVRGVSSANIDDLELIISEWVGKGILDNSILDMLWQYFTKKFNVSDEDCNASLELLRMAASSRTTIITRNIKLVTSVAFGEMGQKNLALLGSACNFLALIGKDRIGITSPNAPFKIGPEDKIFKDLFSILSETFFKPQEFYYHALSGALEFVYKVCGKPDELCEQFIKEIIEKIISQSEEEEVVINRFVYVRLCQLMGLIALKHLDYLDETVYKELKRREHYHSAKKANKNDSSKKKLKRKKNVRTSIFSDCSTMESSILATSATDESNLEGAQAEDEDAEFILHVLERNTVTGSGLLAQLAPIVINICEKPDVYQDTYLQGAAVTALIRYMLVSSEFCMKHIQLIFTIFEKTKYSEIKVSILVHLSDLLTRFPNIIEPWTPKIYDRLKDPSIEIRRATFFTLSGLILRDMIRAHAYIHLMVNSLIDPDKELSSMCRTFFITLSQKENNLYSVLPDIFSYLMDTEHIGEEDSRNIMKFLFELMDKSKYMENLVDRFCAKFPCTEDIRHHRNIAYCLSLILYNDKALKKLQEHFSIYKHLVHDPEIYASFKTLLQGCNKQQVGKVDLKPIVAEIENCISSVFDVNEDAQMMKPPLPPKSAKKRSRVKKANNKRSQRKASSDSDSE